MGEELTNVDRAKSVASLIDHYSGEDEPVEDCIVDVLADLHHLCDTQQLDFDDLNAQAEEHYCVEVKGPQSLIEAAEAEEERCHG